MPLRTRSLAVFALPFALLVATAAIAAQDTLVWRGDHATERAVMEDLAKQYAKDKKGKIELQPFSTVSGLDAVARGTADIAGSARGKYAKRAEEAGINFVPVALDAAVMITHPKNPVRNLTLLQIHDIYYGRIKNWKELGGEDRDINLYAIAAPLDGVEFSVRDLVFHNGDQRVAAPRLYLNTTKLEEAIAIDPTGLGLSTLASVHSNKGVRAMTVENIPASSATIADGSYPLYITLYLAEKEDSPKRAEIDRFIAFVNTPEAKDILKKHELIPYADASDAVTRGDMRVAFIDAHLGGATGSGVTAVAAATPTPVSAPRATLESRTRIAPTAETTQQARENLARAEEKKRAEAAAKKLAEENAAADREAEKKVVVATTTTEPVAAPKPAPEAKPAAPAARVAAPAKKPAAKAKPKPKPKAAKKTELAKAEKKPEKPKAASFDNVDAAAKTKAAPVSFGDVNAGAKTTDAGDH